MEKVEDLRMHRRVARVTPQYDRRDAVVNNFVSISDISA